MNKASQKKLLSYKFTQSEASQKRELLDSIAGDINKIGVLTVGVSYSKNDNLEFLELYSRITKNRAEHLKRAVFRKAKISCSPNS